MLLSNTLRLRGHRAGNYLHERLWQPNRPQQESVEVDGHEDNERCQEIEQGPSGEAVSCKFDYVAGNMK
jgi:hypothetical protein